FDLRHGVAHASTIPLSANQSRAAAASEQIRNTSCTVPVPVYRHFRPESVGYCTLNPGGVLPRRTLIRPGTMRDTCGQSRTIRSRISSSPPTRPCCLLIRPSFIVPVFFSKRTFAPRLEPTRMDCNMDNQPLNVGDVAPDFELMNQDQQLVRLSDFRGKKKV